MIILNINYFNNQYWYSVTLTEKYKLTDYLINRLFDD